MTQRMTILLVPFVAFLLGGCYANKIVDRPIPPKLTDRSISASYDSTWNAVMKVMAQYPLTVIEKESGILNTDWTNRTIYRKVSVWRGLVFGGQVDDMCPMEIMERFNVLVTKADSGLTTIKVIRFVKSRPYLMMSGPKGSWSPNSSGDFVQTGSSTIPENALLDTIEHLITTGELISIDPEEVFREEQEKLPKQQQ